VGLISKALARGVALAFVASNANAAPYGYTDCPDIAGRYAYENREHGDIFHTAKRFSGWILPISTKRDIVYSKVDFSKTLSILSGKLLLGSTVPGLSKRFTCEHGSSSPCVNHVTGSTFTIGIPGESSEGYLPARDGSIVKVFLSPISYPGTSSAIIKKVASCRQNIFKSFSIYESLPRGYNDATWTYWLFEETRSNVKVIKTDSAPKF
jgi:hypothetical protein